MKYYNFGKTDDSYLKPQINCFLKKMKANDQQIDSFVAGKKETLIGVRFNNQLYLLDKEKIDEAGFNLNDEKSLNDEQSYSFILDATERKKDVFLDITTDYMTNNIVRIEMIYYNNQGDKTINSKMLYPEFDITKKVSSMTLKEMNMSLAEYIEACENSQKANKNIEQLNSTICIVNKNINQNELDNFFKTNIHFVKPLDLLKTGIDNYDIDLKNENILNYLIKNKNIIYRKQNEKDINGNNEKEITHEDIMSSVIKSISKCEDLEDNLNDVIKLCIEQEIYNKDQLVDIKESYNEMSQKEFTMTIFEGSKCDGIEAFKNGFLLENACYLSGMDDFELIDPIVDKYEDGECDNQFLTENLFKKLPDFNAFKKKALEYKGDYYKYINDPNYKKYDTLVRYIMPKIAYESFIESKVDYIEKVAENEIMSKNALISINDGYSEAIFEEKWAQTIIDLYENKPLGASSTVRNASLTEAQQEKQDLFNIGAEKIDTTELDEIKKRNKLTWRERLANDTSKYL